MINQRLKEAREMCGMSRRQAMRFSNVQISVVAISEIEDGLREPTEHEIKILADTYEVRPDWLRGDQDE